MSLDANISQQWKSTFDNYWKVYSGTFKEAVSKQAKEFSMAAFKQLKPLAKAKGEIPTMNLARMKAGGGIRIHDYAVPNVWKGGGNMRVSSLLGAYLDSSFKFKSKKARDNASKWKQERSNIRDKYIAASISGKLKGATSNSIERMTYRNLLVQFELQNRDSHRMFTASGLLFRGKMDVETYSKSGPTKIGAFKHVTQPTEKAVAEFFFGNKLSDASAHVAKGLKNPKQSEALNKALMWTVGNMRDYIGRKNSEAARKAASHI